MMNQTQGYILISVLYRLLVTVVLILAVLLFGDRIRQWIGVQGSETKENIKQGIDSDVQSKQSPTYEPKFASRKAIG
jgi:hypothetical protein